MPLRGPSLGERSCWALHLLRLPSPRNPQQDSISKPSPDSI
jgi:hypothetical protein